jgi:hypothetical protein
MHAPGLWGLQFLRLTGGPTNDGAIDDGPSAQSEVQSALIL